MPRFPNRLQFKDPRTPFSEQFGDIYFANEEGIEESIYVYLEGSGVQHAIQSGQPLIRIGEVGFGVALNFLLTLREFLKHASIDQRLHYTTAEKFPIEACDLETLYDAYPELAPFAKLLLNQYPVLTPGLHRLHFANERVVLDLLIGDAALVFETHHFAVDFWYWDGFAPSKNPDAFSDPVFAAVQKRSALGCKGTSFTAATWVRRGLEVRGFQVNKRRGFGRKRECIEAVLTKPAEDEPSEKNPRWFSRDAFPTIQRGEKIAVIGAGLSGSAIARKLATLGFPVQVFDGDGIANRASSNSVGLFNIQLSKKSNPLSRFSQASLTHFIRELNALQLPKRLGLLRKDDNAMDCLIDSDYPESFYEMRGDEVYLPWCGMIRPKHLCEVRMEHPLIDFTHTHITRIQKSENGFQLEDSLGEIVFEAHHVVYALGAEFSLPLNSIPLKAIRGQTILVKPTPASRNLECVKVNEGYVSPIAEAVTGHLYHLIGATFQAKPPLPEPQQVLADRKKLVNEARDKWAIFQELNESQVVSEKVGFRASTPDKMPVIGPLPLEDFLKKNYESTLRGGPRHDLPPLAVHPGEWVMMGMGSRGIPFSSLGAEILASLMTGFPLPVEEDLFHHLHPVRFLIRGLRKSASS